MDYTPRFTSSPSVESAWANGRNGDIDSPSPAKVSPYGRPHSPAASPPTAVSPRAGNCWVCAQPCVCPGYPGAPTLFFSSYPLVSPWAASPSRDLHARELHTAAAPLSSLTLCDRCVCQLTRRDAEGRIARTGLRSCAFVTALAAYKALLERLSRKVLRASESLRTAEMDPASALELVEVTADTPLARAPPQLQVKLLRALVAHLEEATGRDFASRDRSHGGHYLGTGEAAMTQAERNVLLGELVRLDRALVAVAAAPSVEPEPHDGIREDSLANHRRRSEEPEVLPSARAVHEPGSLVGAPHFSSTPRKVAPVTTMGRDALAGLVERGMWRTVRGEAAEDRTRAHPSVGRAASDTDGEGSGLRGPISGRGFSPVKSRYSFAQRSPADRALAPDPDHRLSAEHALQLAHRRVAALGSVGRAMGEELLTSRLSFTLAFHLERLNDFFGTAVTFAQMFCLRKSMLFAEVVAELMRGVSRRAMRAAGAANGRVTKSLPREGGERRGGAPEAPAAQMTSFSAAAAAAMVTPCLSVLVESEAYAESVLDDGEVPAEQDRPGRYQFPTTVQLHRQE